MTTTFRSPSFGAVLREAERQARYYGVTFCVWFASEGFYAAPIVETTPKARQRSYLILPGDSITLVEYLEGLVLKRAGQ